MAILNSNHASIAGSSATIGLAVILVGAVVYSLGRVVYNLFFHPLRSYPGPLVWRATSVPYDFHAFRGTSNFKIRDMHLRYGEVVRVNPNQLSFASEQAARELWGHRPGHPEFPKDPARIQRPPNGIPNILNAPNEEHARYRRLLSHAFSEKGMQTQEPLIKQYVDLLVERLSERAETGEDTDMVEWYNLVTFDLIGDLAFGDPFHCLRDRTVHPWVRAVPRNVVYVFQKGVLQRWGLTRLEKWLLPQGTLKGRLENYRYAQAKMDERIRFGEERGDFWDRVIAKSADGNKGGAGMSPGEMLNNASVMVLGGSETVATVLSVATYLLLKHPESMAKLKAEVRSAFQDPSEITLFSVGKLKYMLAVLDEAQRVFPAVPEPAVRAPPQGGSMMCGKYVPEGTTLGVSLIGAFASPSNFARPNDFVPERWLSAAKEPDSEFAGDQRGVMQPFSLGTRNCIGKNLAYAEMRLILAKMMWHFDMELAEGKTGDWFDQRSWGIWEKNPLWVKLRLASH